MFLTVYASDLKFKDDSIKPVFPKMPIAKLLKGQEIELEATIGIGNGKDHAKHNPALAFYQGEAIIKVKDVKNAEDVFKECPREVFKLDGKTLKVDDASKCILCNACSDLAEPEGSIEVNGSEADFKFTLESWGQYTPIELLERALDMLDEKVSTFETLVDKAK